MARTVLRAVVLSLAAIGPARPATEVGGLVETSVWTAAGSPYDVSSDLTVPVGASLTMEAGVDVRFAGGVSMVVRGTLRVLGARGMPVRFLARDEGERWAGVAVDGEDALAVLEHLELTDASRARVAGRELAGAVNGTGGARLELTGCWFHDFPNPVVDVSGGSELVIRDTLIERSREAVHAARSYAHLEGVTIRDIFGYSDSIDFDGASMPPSVIRNCLLDGNLEDDGIDLSGSNALVEDVEIRGVVGGKAISLDGAGTPVFRRVLVHGSMLGLVVKDSSTPFFQNCTVAACEAAVKCYQKTAGRGGGHGTAENLIIWGNQTSVDLDARSTFEASYSIIAGGYEGEGNLDADPLFAAAESGDFRLRPESPAIGSGRDGAEMGALPAADGPTPRTFVRGEVNGDGNVDISDAVLVLLFLFAGGSATCLDALDADDSGALNVTDAVYLLRHLFAGGPPPPPPFPVAGADPTPAEALGCE